MPGIFDRIAGAGSADEVQDTVPADETLADFPDDEPLSTVANDAVEERRTPRRVRETVQELLKYGLLEESHKPNLYRTALVHGEEMAAALEALDLAMGVDEVRGLVFVTVRHSEAAEEDDWSHPLVRRQRLNLEQSLLIAILRQHFIVYEQESGTGANQALVAVDELIPQMQAYLGDLGSEARERNRIIGALDQLNKHGVVSAPDEHDRVAIRPIIAHLANPENLLALVAWLRAQVSAGTACDATDEEETA